MADRHLGLQLRERVLQLERAPLAARPAMTARIREQADQLGEQLNIQHEWLFNNSASPKFGEYEERWLKDLKHYEFTYDALNRVTEQKEFSA